MTYTSQIIINKPIDKVIELFDNPENMKYWMEGLESFESISGTPGKQGAKSKLVFNNGGRKMEMIETITVRNLPSEFTGVYEAPGVWNLSRNIFEKISDTETKYINENEFKFTTVFMKIIGFIFGGSFKKQSYKYQEAFKKFVESK